VDPLIDNPFPYVQSLVALFVIANPVGMIPLYLTLTSDQKPEDKARSPRLAAMTMGVTLALSAVGGARLLDFFGISIASLQVGGGVLLFTMGLSMLQARHNRAKHTPEEAAEAEDRDVTAIVPVGIPLLAGPGSIGTTMIYSGLAQNWTEIGILVAACGLIAFIAYGALKLAEPIRRVLGRTGLNIVMRLQGLILTALAAEFITSGISTLLPGLRG